MKKVMFVFAASIFMVACGGSSSSEVVTIDTVGVDSTSVKDTVVATDEALVK